MAQTPVSPGIGHEPFPEGKLVPVCEFSASHAPNHNLLAACRLRWKIVHHDYALGLDWLDDWTCGASGSDQEGLVAKANPRAIGSAQTALDTIVLPRTRR